MYFTALYFYKNLFIIELLMAEFLFCFYLKKKNAFILRFGLISCICLIISFVIPIFYNNSISSSILFLSLFLMTLPLLKFCYDEPFINVFFCSIAAYTTQHLAYSISNLLTSFIKWGESPMVNIYYNSTSSIQLDGYFFAWLSLYFICYIGVYAGTFFLCAKKINYGGSMKIKNLTLLLLIGCALIINIILNTISIYNQNNALTNAVESIYNIVSCILLLYGQFSLLHTKVLENELLFVKKLWHQEKEQYQISKENIDLINIKCHDIKHQIRQIGQNKSISEDVVKELENSISLYDSLAKTGNNVLDIILTEKNLYCKKNQITLTYIADGEKLNFMEESDIYSLFGNALDNALEAVIKIKEYDKRIIELKIHTVNDLLTINIRNSYEGKINFDDDGLPITTKEDSSYHGYGVKSIYLIVDKYNGNVSFKEKNNMFSLNILIPLEN